MSVVTKRNRLGMALPAIIALGIVCRVVQYLWRRSYWHDESYLVLNIVGARIADAIGPLKLLQAAPPAFLIVEIYASRLFGASEYSLRLVPLVLACASVVMMAVLAQRLAGRFVGCLATLLFAVSDQLIWHASECKQYSGDVFVALTLLLLATGRDDAKRFAAIGLLSTAAVWFSHTTMFVFGGISLVAIVDSTWLRSRRCVIVYVVVNAIFAASLVALYVTSIRPQQYPEMYAYWHNDFVPWAKPLGVPFWLLSLANYACDNGGPVILVTAIVGGIAWWRAGRRRVVLLLMLPLLLNLVASALHRFPFSGTRVTLYSAPAIFLLAAVGCERIVRRADAAKWAWIAWTVPGWVVLVGLIPAIHALAVPRHRGHVRPSAEFIAAHRQGDEPIYVVGIAEPWRCYLTDPSIPWRSIQINDAATLSDDRFWIVYASASPADARRQDAAVKLAAASASIDARIDVVGSTAVHFVRPTTSRPSISSTGLAP